MRDYEIQAPGRGNGASDACKPQENPKTDPNMAIPL